MKRPHVAPIAVLVAALAALGGSIAWAATRDGTDGSDMMRSGSGMMGYTATGQGEPVSDVAVARRQAERFADRLDLRVGEVMRFDNHYYAELTDSNGKGATEVLVDPESGAVLLEPGPAMMWNTRYGMMGGAEAIRDLARVGRGGMMGQGGMMGPGWVPGQSPSSRTTGSVSAAEARTIAQRWLRGVDVELTVGEPDAFPGYFALHTTRAGQVDGMLSVNAETGAVWYHWWHGRFIEMTE